MLCKIVFAKYTIVILFFVNFLCNNLYYRSLSLLLILSLVTHQTTLSLYYFQDWAVGYQSRRHFSTFLFTKRNCHCWESRKECAPDCTCDLIVMVKKPNGKYHFCLDFRKIKHIKKGRVSASKYERYTSILERYTSYMVDAIYFNDRYEPDVLSNTFSVK